ncbi:MAG: right-handed parallel beta-helix repeat-containing protein, partial [Bacteroidales bacterium]|nr:right-handed parallel beta-helix repeat-containing protein [Bacteroidales bacterium]
KVTSGNTKLGDFSIDMPSLTAGTNYYYKVYAVNSYGTSYSNEQRAITSEDIALKSFDMNIIQHVEQLESSKPVSLSIVNEGISISAGGSIDVKIEYPVGIEVINNTIILEEDFNFGDTLNFITDDDLLFNQIGGRHEFLGIISYPDDAYNANDSLFGYILAIDVDFKFKDEVNDTIQVDTFPYQLKVDYTWVPDTAFNTEFLWINQGLSDSVIFIGEDGWYPVECKMSNTIHYDSVYVNSPSVDPDEKGIIYVTQNGKGDGSSWANATNRLQKAIDNVDAKQIWVAEGTYYPNKPRDYNDSLNLSFVLKDSVEMYGGFSGTESFLSDRDPQQNPSILNGNLGDPGVLSDNAINVVFCPDGIEGYTIDGFTISGGNGGLSGGGILALGEGSVENCIIRNNSSDGEGGGIYMQDGSIVNCVIEDNTGDFGGGAYLQGGAEVVSCTIQNNTALNTGGGIYSYMSNIESCLVFNNTSVNSGGGIYLTESFVNNTNVVNNRANTAGGIYTDQNNYIYNTLIANNTAVTAGAISIGNWNVIQHATIANNSANEHGGVYVQDLNSTIANTILWGNTDNLNSYQLYKAADYSLSFINSATTNVSLINWGASTTVEKAITLDSDNNVATGPRFFAPSDTVGFVEDIAIQQQLLETNWGIADSSVCVDSASDNYGISSDMNDTPRPLKYGYDIGAFESIPTLKMSRPSASDISYGQPLDSSKVTGMVYCGDSLVEGNYVMVDSNYYPNDIGMIKATVIFKPATDNFQSEVDSVEIMVNKAKLTVTAEDKYRKPGEDNPELTFIYDGFVFDEQSSVLDTEPTISTTADISSPEGTYPITLSGGSDNHYEFVYVEGTLTVTLSSLSSEIAAAVKVYPNPVKDQLHIETGDDIIRNYQIQSISGTIINKGTISTGIIDVSSLRTGIYFLTINDAVYRIVKQ